MFLYVFSYHILQFFNFLVFMKHKISINNRDDICKNTLYIVNICINNQSIKKSYYIPGLNNKLLLGFLNGSASRGNSLDEK